jgi:hypothetical protein
MAALNAGTLGLGHRDHAGVGQRAILTPVLDPLVHIFA